MSLKDGRGGDELLDALDDRGGDELLDALESGRIAAGEPPLDARWDRWTRGELPAEEVEVLRALAESSDDAKVAERAFAPLDDAVHERLAERWLAMRAEHTSQTDSGQEVPARPEGSSNAETASALSGPPWWQRVWRALWDPLIVAPMVVAATAVIALAPVGRSPHEAMPSPHEAMRSVRLGDPGAGGAAVEVAGGGPLGVVVEAAEVGGARRALGVGSGLRAGESLAVRAEEPVCARGIGAVRGPGVSLVVPSVELGPEVRVWAASPGCEEEPQTCAPPDCAVVRLLKWTP